MQSDPHISPARVNRPVVDADVEVAVRCGQVQGPTPWWQPWRRVLSDVFLLQEPRWVDGAAPLRGELRAVKPLPGTPTTASAACWLFPFHRATLFRDDAERYCVHTTRPRPRFCVSLQLDHERTADGGTPLPQMVTLSDDDAGRWLNGQEEAGQAAAPAPLVEWLTDHVAWHHRPEPKRRRRLASFEPLIDRSGQPARISKEKLRGPRSPRADS